MKSFSFLLAMQPCVVFKEVPEITVKLSNKDLILCEENTVIFLGIFTQEIMIFCYLILFLLIKTQ